MTNAIQGNSDWMKLNIQSKNILLPPTPKPFTPVLPHTFTNLKSKSFSGNSVGVSRGFWDPEAK